MIRRPFKPLDIAREQKGSSVLRGRRLFYGWWIVLTGAVLQLLQGALLSHAYGSYVVVLREEFGWSRTTLSFASSLREIETGALGPIQGWLVDRFGPRRIARLGIVCMGVGFMLFSQVQTLLTFYGAFAIVAVGAGLMGYLTITTVVVQWFERRRSIALSLTSIGGAVGGIVVPLTVFGLESIGWRATAFVSGVLVLVVGLPMTRFLVSRPSDMGLFIDGVPPDDGTESTRVTHADFTLREALREPSFWWLSLGHGFALLIVGAVNVHLASHLTESLDYSLGQASFVASGITTMFLLGTLAGGWIGDHASKRLMAFVCMGMHAVAMLLLSHAVSSVMVVAFVLIHGSAWGMRGPQMAALRADYFGRTSFGKIMGISNIMVFFGAVLGPLLAGFIYDQTGNYRIGFDTLAILAALGSGFFALARRPKPKVPEPLEVVG